MRFWKNRMPNAVEWAALALFGISVLILVSLLLDPPNRLMRRAGGGFFLSREPFLLLGTGTYLLAGLVGFWSAVIFLRNRIHHLTLKVFGVTMMAVSFSTLLALGATEPVSRIHYGGYVGVLITDAFEGVSPLLSMPLVGIVFVISLVFATDWFFYELLRGDSRHEPAATEPGRLTPGVSVVEEEALTRITPAPVAAPPPDVEEVREPVQETAPEAAEATEAPAAPGEPMIARRIVPDLEPVHPIEREEEAVEPEETEVGPEEATEEAVEAAMAPDTETVSAPAVDATGFRIYLPDVDETEDEEETPREFTGKIAAYLEEDEEEEQPDEAEAFDEAEPPGERIEPVGEDESVEEDEEVEEEEEEADTGIALDTEDDEGEEEESRVELAEEEERVAEPDPEGAPAVLTATDHQDVEAEGAEEAIEKRLADDDEEDESATEEELAIRYAFAGAEEEPDAEVAEEKTAPPAEPEEAEPEEAEPEETEASETEVLEVEVVDPAEENIFEVIATLDEPHTSRPLDDEPVDEVEDDEPAIDEEDDKEEEEEEAVDEEEDEEEGSEASSDEIFEEVIRVDLDDDRDGDAPGRMLYAEAFEEAAPHSAGTETEPQTQIGAEEDPLAEAARRRQPEPFAPGEDPFADAPMTGGSLDESAKRRPGQPRTRRAAAQLDMAMEELLPSLSRMKKKITDLEVTDPRLAGGQGNDRIYLRAVDAVFESNRASAAVLKRKLRVDAIQADDLLSRMESEGVVGPRKGKRGARDILISRREFEASHDAPRA
jgi:hypothetical protein